ncbi:hypothetical protein M3Y94_01003800 [Aphelenchoides besseyi]|nr:hypothetical protein M3Y94_01003800 [Aphelenchoides besseyi]
MKIAFGFLIVFGLLIGAADGHIGLLIGLGTKILGGIVKVNMQIFGPIAMSGFKAFFGLLMGSKHNGDAAGNSAGGLGGLLGGAFGGSAGNNAGGLGNAGANGGIGGAANGAVSGSNGFIGNLISGFQGLLKQYFGIFTGLIGGSKSWADTVKSVVQGGLTNFFNLFGGLALSTQTAIADLLAHTIQVMSTVLKLKLGVGQSAQAIVKSEGKLIKSIMEKQFSNFGSLIGSLGSAAPKISGSFGLSYHLAKQSYQTQLKKLDPHTREHYNKLVEHVKSTHQKLGVLIQNAAPKTKSDLGVVYNVMKNLHLLSGQVL